jgi:membrane-associated phospholipid phosphatase
LTSVPDAAFPPAREPGNAVAPTRAAWARLHTRHPLWAAALPGIVLIAIGLLGFAVMLDSVAEQDDFTILDEPVLDFLVANRTPALTAILLAITFISGPVVLPIVVGVACLVWGLRARDWWRPILLIGAMITSVLISLAVKSDVARPRPPLEDQVIPGAETTLSFPSGHTISTATLCLVGGYLVWSRHRSRRALVAWLTTTVLATGAVGLSRLYLGYHFVTDVLAAIALAVAILGVVTVVDRIHLLRRRGPPSPEPSGPHGTRPVRRR